MPLDEKWEFPRDQLTIISDLGMGNFGKVMMAHATSLITEGVTTTVAVKMLKGNKSEIFLENQHNLISCSTFKMILMTYCDT